MSRLPLVLLLALIPACAGTTVQERPAPASPEPASPAPLDTALFERVAILGASVSAGFNLQLETGVTTRMADFLDEALLAPHAIAFDGATEMMFLDAVGMGTSMVEGALAVEPTLVLAIDFPFWFLYGPGSSSADRLDRLEVGLELLGRFDGPVVVGDIPFMADAAGGMIPHSSMPDADAFEPANARIAAWAAEDERRTLVSLAGFNRTLRAGEDFAVAGRTWRPAEDGELLQLDHLHPNMAGTAVLLIQALSRLAEDRGELLEGAVITHPEDLTDLVDDRLM